jgi:transcriptional regulator with XRE-family HTH domain
MFLVGLNSLVRIGGTLRYSRTRLRAVRKAYKVTKGRKISQEALALKCHLDRSYVGRVKRGEINISLINIVRLAEALEVEAGELFSGWK